MSFDSLNPELLNQLNLWIEKDGFDSVYESTEFKKALKNDIEPLKKRLKAMMDNLWIDDIDNEEQDFQFELLDDLEKQQEEISESEEINRLWHKALSLEINNKIDKTLKIIKKIFEKEPENFIFWPQIYKYYDLYETPEEKNALLDEMINIHKNNPHDINLLFGLSEILSMEILDEDIQKKLTPYYEKLVQKVEDSQDVKLVNNFYYLQVTIDPIASEKTLLLLTKIDRSPESFLDACSLHLQRGEYKKAYSYFLQAKKIDATNPKVIKKEQEEFRASSYPKQQKEFLDDISRKVKYPHPEDVPQKIREIYKKYIDSKKYPRDFSGNN